MADHTEDAWRGTGRTTAIVLAAIAQALRYPDKPVTVFDHWHTLQASESAVRLAELLVSRMGLGGFEFSPHHRTIVFRSSYWTTRK